MEKLLHYIWQHKMLPISALQTTQGETVEIIDTGLPNADAGPDFFNAKIKLNNVLWVGNVEIHLRASDWFKHNHDTDPAYQSIILHVVAEADVTIRRTNGEEIPQLVLPIPTTMKEKYEHLIKERSHFPCENIIQQMPALKWNTWIAALQIERLEEKTARIQNLLRICNGNWEQTFFILLSRNFGFSVNSDAFELWAKHISLPALAKHRDSLLCIEALFFGTSGLMNHLKKTDDYTERLRQEYLFLVHKFSLPTPPHIPWKYLRLRPSNFPHLRIAQLACLYQRAEGLFSQIVEERSLAKVKELFRGGASVYWNTHDYFGETIPERSRTLTDSAIDLLIINTVIPVLYAYGLYLSDEERCKRAIEWTEALRPENNHIIRQWAGYGINIQHAGHTQAILQLHKQYCLPKKCLQCRIGYEFLRTTSLDK